MAQEAPLSSEFIAFSNTLRLPFFRPFSVQSGADSDRSDARRMAPLGTTVGTSAPRHLRNALTGCLVARFGLQSSEPRVGGSNPSGRNRSRWFAFLTTDCTDSSISSEIARQKLAVKFQPNAFGQGCISSVLSVKSVLAAYWFVATSGLACRLWGSHKRGRLGPRGFGQLFSFFAVTGMHAE